MDFAPDWADLQNVGAEMYACAEKQNLMADLAWMPDNTFALCAVVEEVPTGPVTNVPDYCRDEYIANFEAIKADIAG